MNITAFIEQLQLSVGDAYTLRFMESKISEAETAEHKQWAEQDLHDFMVTLCNRNVDKIEWSA